MKKLELNQMEMIEGGDCTKAVTAFILTGAFAFLTGGAASGLVIPAIGTALACLADN
jgi:hypothetical protein